MRARVHMRVYMCMCVYMCKISAYNYNIMCVLVWKYENTQNLKLAYLILNL